ncbi:response regulator transcription factor [Actinomadura sp. WMMA1423]|uniref:response regulator n=1 Tax=Actinomadura sp. WMMA1423 TaxID=2591108 RepID=UPI0011461B8C|nr:response regulator transcription factor [Actinomadura sp. WMMA1423]
MTIRVVVADDQAAVRTGLALILDNAKADIKVVGQASDGHQAVEMTKELKPDVVLMDVRMPGLDGISATRQIAALTNVLVLTTFDTDEYVFGAFRAGAVGFLLKDVAAERLVESVQLVERGDGVVAPEVTRKLISAFAHRSVPDKIEVDALTPREQEVLGYLGHGFTNAEIASRLDIADTTAKTHVSRIFTKLGLRSRVQAAVVAQEVGLTARLAEDTT